MTNMLSIALAALLLAGCGPAEDKKPLMDQQRQVLEKAKKVDSIQQQETQKLQQDAEKQAQ